MYDCDDVDVACELLVPKGWLRPVVCFRGYAFDAIGPGVGSTRIPAGLIHNFWRRTFLYGRNQRHEHLARFRLYHGHALVHSCGLQHWQPDLQRPTATAITSPWA